MKYTVEKTHHRPAYIQLYAQLREDILSGVIERGKKLPSKRLLAAETGVSVITVQHAYELLVDEGYAQSVERSGYFACFGESLPKKESPLLPLAEEKSISSELPEDFPFSTLAKIMRRVLSDYDRRILAKAPNLGCMELRQAIADYLQRSRGIAVSPRQIVIGSGAEYLYSLVVQLLGRSECIAVEDPCYEKIRQVYKANGAKVLPLKLGQDGIISDELASCQALALHVTPFNSYPSGVTASAAKRREYAVWAQGRGAYIVEDDYDSEFSLLSQPVETVFSLCPGHVIYVNSFSKTIAPALRTGYMILSPELLERYEEKLGFYSCTVPVFEQYVLAEFISGGDMERHINRQRRRLRQKLAEGRLSAQPRED